MGELLYKAESRNAPIANSKGSMGKPQDGWRLSDKSGQDRQTGMPRFLGKITSRPAK